ncbi:MAG: hypothetical protein RLZZ444_4723, partial [Pseudomonadota bacterium]
MIWALESSGDFKVLRRLKSEAKSDLV